MAAPSKLKAAKPSKVVKPNKRNRYSTPHTRNHRFQPFSERIANLKIDPIRRRRNEHDREHLTEETATYFGRSLVEWQDLNLSATFTAFSRKASPLSDSLPVVLHNEEKIKDLLIEYIEKADELAMEPLLNLMSHFAHDLDTRFEKYFGQVVATITAVAAKHQDPAVVEWSFTCLAWLFKYLQRLLAPDLRPLYDLLSPYLGKEVQKPFIVRFAAESLSFLLRKSAATYEKDPEGLDRIMSHILKDAATSESGRSPSMHEQGIMTLFTETIKGVQNGIHSCGTAVIQSLLKAASQLVEENKQTIRDICTGTLTSLIHHTNSETFLPLVETILSWEQSTKAVQQPVLRLKSSILMAIASVRKGTRISTWKPVAAVAKDLINQAEELPNLESDTANSVLATLAIVLQNSTIDAVLSTVTMLEKLRQGQMKSFFLLFCDCFARLGRDRFHDFLLPQFQKYVLENWEQQPIELCRILPQFASRGQQIKINLSSSKQENLLNELERVLRSDSPNRGDEIASANAILSSLEYLKLDEASIKRLRSALLAVVQNALEAPSNYSGDFQRFSTGSAFHCLLDLCNDNTSLEGLWKSLCSVSSTYSTQQRFWVNLFRYMKICKPSDLEGEHITTLENSLVQAVSLPSHEIRESALDVAQKLYKLKSQSEPDCLSTAILIESTSINLNTARSISMNIRRLATSYADAASDEFVARIIPNFCFGLLHIRLSQAWDDATTALSEMCSVPAGEEAIILLAQSWLDSVPDLQDDSVEAPRILDSESDGFQVVSDFQCSNFMRMDAVANQVFSEPDSGYASPVNQLHLDNAVVPQIAGNAREQALKVLAKMPSVAEKRSRILVPVLLKWAGSNTTTDDEDADIAHRWSRKDQKSMLAIFAQFNNPKVLFRSVDVYHALLNLCGNGDVEIQTSALKAVFAWKDMSINRYEEHLVNLLDEARFREEISVFLQNASQEEEVRTEDYAHLMPVLLRLLYGRAVAGGKHGQASRRKAIFVALSQFGESTLGLFVAITMSNLRKIEDADTVMADGIDTTSLPPLRQQLGMLNMLDELFETLGSELQPFAKRILDAVILCTVSASKQLENAPEGAEPKHGSLLRSVRQVGMQCLVKIFANIESSEFAAQASEITKELVLHRLDKFASENSQSVSGTLRLFAAWSASPESAPYINAHNDSILSHVAGLLREPSAKDAVRLFILQEILDNLVEDGIDNAVLQSHVSAFVKSIGYILRQKPSKEILDACVRSFKNLAGRIVDATEAEDVIEVCTDLLIKPNKVVSPPTKTGLLQTLLPLLDRFDTAADGALFEALCGLASRVQDQKTRHILAEALVRLCKADQALLESAEICADLEAQGGRLDEPDHERRERGFTKIYQNADSFSLKQWLPILHTCMFFVRDADDLVNRSSASQALARFVDAASKRGLEFEPLLNGVLLPGIEYGVRHPSELVRAEYMSLLGLLVESNSNWPSLNDMKILTVGGDDEASVFNNLLHIQQHRRLRALRRLADEAKDVKSDNIAKLLLPALEHFVFDPAEGDSGRTLADQTVVTVGALARSLNWSTFRATFRRYTSYITSKEEHEKTVLRLLGALVDALSTEEGIPTAESQLRPSSEKATIITRDFLPPLMTYLNKKDESTVDRRMPVAVTIVKLLLQLPETELSVRLPPVLTDVSHVLRSRSQEARDQTRRTLASILALIGPGYLGFMLKELRTSLQRGYQLHVLSFTVHSLLVGITDRCKPGDLDHCLPELTAIILDDIFGVTGQEKDAEEYKSGMKEVKSSKSFDTMELLARVTPITKLGLLIRPLRALLSEKLDAKAVTKADELLTRMRKGIDQNPAADSRDMLVFCHEVVRQVYTEQAASKMEAPILDYKVRKYLIQMESANKSKKKGATTSQMFKLVSFALNLVRRVVRRHDDLQTPANMTGFLPMAGDALVQGQEEVRLAAVRLLSTIIRLPIGILDANAPVYVKEAISMIKAANSMTTEASKAALELVTAVLREKRSVDVKERDIAFLLKTLKTDIDEPDRQGIIYKFLRAVLGRKIVITEVYETMDEVGKVMVTNPDRQVRESARSAYSQFVMDYPQGKDRWNKQAGFFVENLKYEHPSGRQSVMELLHQLLTKLGDETLQQLGFTFFVALVPLQISDPDQTCRQMAGLLLAKLFERAEGEQLSGYLTLINKWLSNEAKPMVQVAALQCWTTYLRSGKATKKQQNDLREEIAGMLVSETVVVGPQLLQGILQVISTMTETATETIFHEDAAIIWDNMIQCLTASSTDIQEAASQLVGSYLTHIAVSSSKTEAGLSALPLVGSGGLELDDDDLRQLCRTSLRVFMTRSSEMSETLVTQTSRNIVFLGRCFAANNMLWLAPSEESDDEEGEDDEANEENDDDKSVSKCSSTAIAYLLNRLSYITRQDTYALAARTSAVQTQAALLPHLPSALPNLASLLRPLYSLTDASIPHASTPAFTALVDRARELLEAIRSKVGAEVYVKALGEARKQVQQAREERRQKRKIGAVAQPEKWAKEKRRKHEAVRQKKKEKGREARGMRRGW